MKVLVLGAGGQVGRELCRYSWPDDTRLVAIDRAGLDITRREAVFAVIADIRPDIVVNAAAYTAVDRAESEPEPLGPPTASDRAISRRRAANPAFR